MLRQLVVLVVVLCAGGVRAADRADLVLKGGVVITCDAVNSQAQAVAVTKGRVTAVGSDADIQPLIGDGTKVIDLAGRVVTPGFIECHGHLLGLGRLRIDVDLSSCKSWEECIQKVAERAKTTREGEWIIGRGWHQEHWDGPANADGTRYPMNAPLSQATPKNPVLLVHGTGHMAIANAEALKAAGITKDSTPPKGGEFLRDAEGNLTGVLRETASDAVHAAYERKQKLLTAAERDIENRRAIDLAVKECLAKGVTSFQDAGSSFADVDLFRKLQDEGKLGLRLWVMLSASPETLAKRMVEARTIGDADRPLTVRAIKCMADGALGSHGALLLKPYVDLPQSTGLRIHTLNRIEQTAILAAQNDYQLCTHAIGDQAIREVLDIYERVQRMTPGKDRRWRMEHLQHIDPADIPRLKELGVIASMQGNHATSDGPFVVTRLGEERARVGAYAWRSIVDSGATLINGTDVPVEDVNPLLCLRSTVTRRMANGKQFFPEQCLTPIEALRSYTIDAAFGAFEEKEKGSIEVGKLADLVVLSGSPVTTPGDELGNLRVEKTIVGGKVAYER
ncbi:MAG TPA: amidohydrolase [Caulifigura sp.]|jgi:predicted amidohydrolase YtcJ|nr:amidohydrolase [Caulifigura sp.]